MIATDRAALNAEWDAAIAGPVGSTDAAGVALRLGALRLAVDFGGPTAEVHDVLRAAAFFTKFALDGVAPPPLAHGSDDD